MKMSDLKRSLEQFSDECDVFIEVTTGGKPLARAEFTEIIAQDAPACDKCATVKTTVLLRGQA